MDIMMIAAFVGFFALVLAWLAAPADARRPVAVAPVIEPGAVGAD